MIARNCSTFPHNEDKTKSVSRNYYQKGRLCIAKTERMAVNRENL
jgi:hypothetical protein